MLRHELRQSDIRSYKAADAGYWTPPDAICSVTWLTPHVIVLHGLKGEHTRATWREVLDWLVQMDIRRVFAERSALHQLPCAHPCDVDEGWYRIEVLDLLAHFRHRGKHDV